MKKLISAAVFAAFICCVQAGVAQAAPWCDESDWAAADAKCKEAGHGCATAASDGCPNYSGGAVHCSPGALVAGGVHPKTNAKTDKGIRSDLAGKFSAKAAAKTTGAAAAKKGLPTGRRSATATDPVKTGGTISGKYFVGPVGSSMACCRLCSDPQCVNYSGCKDEAICKDPKNLE